MSLLAEALKALAERPVAADGEANALAGAETPPPRGEDESQLTDSRPEELLESAAAAVAESLNADADIEPMKAAREDSNRDAADGSMAESSADWAEVWQQALWEKEPAESSGDLTGEDSSTSAANVSGAEFNSLSPSEDRADSGSESDESIDASFDPWFAAHGLINLPLEPIDWNANSNPTDSEIECEVEPQSSETAEAGADAAEAGADADVAAASLYTEQIDTPASETTTPTDSTWELYDRSAEFSAPWGFEQNAPADQGKPTPGTQSDSTRPRQPSVEKLSEQPPETSTPAANTPEAGTPTESSRQSDRELGDSQSWFAPASQVADPTRTETESTHSADSASSVSEDSTPTFTNAQQIHTSTPAVASPNEGIRVTEPYLRLAGRVLQSLRAARPQAIVLAAADEASANTLDLAQWAKAITLSEEGKLLVIQAHSGRPELSRRLGILPDQHPRWPDTGGGNLAESIHCSGQGRIDLLLREKLSSSTDLAVDSLLIARCKRHYPLVLIDVGALSSELAQSLVPQGDAALLVAVLQHTPREVAAQSTLLLRRLGVRTAGCILMEPRPNASFGRG
jgi:hypothetical protein